MWWVGAGLRESGAAWVGQGIGSFQSFLLDVCIIIIHTFNTTWHFHCSWTLCGRQRVLMLSGFPIVTYFPVLKGQDAKVWFPVFLPVIGQIHQKQGRTHFAKFKSPYQIKSN